MDVRSPSGIWVDAARVAPILLTLQPQDVT